MSRVPEIGLYLILTRPMLSPVDFAEVCVECGIRMLQLREKDLSDREQLALAQRLVAITRHSVTRLLIDDRIDLAILSGADGVHLGQTDLPPEAARRLLPPEMLLGLSTHSLTQARDALAQKPDYIGFGPLFPTPTKKIPDPAVGLDRLREVLSFTNVPVVGIGGVFPENLPDILSTGVQTVAMVRYFMAAATRAELRRRIESVQCQLAAANPIARTL